MSSEARLRLRIGADTSQAENNLGRLSSSLTNISTKIGSGLASAVKIGLGSLAALSTAGVAVGVNFNAAMEQSRIGWASILGSAEAATKMVKELQQMGAATPFETEELDQAAKLLTMAGFKGKDLFTTLTNVGDAVSAIGGNGETLQGIAMALFQMGSKGKVSAEEMNQMAERGIPSWQMLADGMHMSVQEVMKLSEQGKLFAKDAIPLMVSAMGGKFGGAMEDQSHTFNGMLSTIKDNLKILGGVIAEGPFERLKQGMEKVLPILGGVTQLMKGDKMGFITTISQAFSPDKAVGIIKFFMGIQDGIKKFQTVMDNVKLVVSGLFEAFSGNTGGAISVLSMLGLDSAQIQLVLQAVSLIKSYISGLMAYWTAIWNGLKVVISSLWSWLSPYIMVALQAIVTFISSRLDMIKQFWAENGTQIMEALQNFWSVVTAVFNFFLPVLLFIVKFIWDAIKGVIDGALKIIMGLIKIFAGIFTGDFSKIWEGVKQLFIGALQFLWNLMNLMLVGDIVGVIKGFGVKGLEFFKGFGTKVMEFFKNLWGDLFKGVDKWVADVKTLFGILKAYGDTTFQAFKQIMVNLWEGIANGVTSKVTALKNGAMTIFDGMKASVQYVFETIKGFITNPIEQAKNTILDIIGVIKKAFSAMKIVIPKVKLPKVSVSMKKGVMGIPYPDFDVSWNKNGGIWDGASVIGVGEAGPEAVVPLSGHRMQPFAKAIAAQMGGSRGDTIITGNTFHVREEADIDRVAQRLLDLQNRRNR